MRKMETPREINAACDRSAVGGSGRYVYGVDGSPNQPFRIVGARSRRAQVGRQLQGRALHDGKWYDISHAQEG